MDKKELTFNVDTTDHKALVKLMDDMGGNPNLYVGKNEEGEQVQISIEREKITIETHQVNGWIRQNIYYRDGTSDETFDGKWR